ncbi:MAG: hypothetical protein ACJ8CR_35625 [Roseiflexaceae bacterium]
MSADEILVISQRYRERIESILTPQQLTRFDAYQQRVQAAIARRDATPVLPTSDEQAVLDELAADMQAATLRKQLDILLRIEIPPQ